jgi:two-component system, NarL family, sensor histidine kinase UhpB
MSLRYQISLRILLYSLIILALGGSIATWQARNAINEEVASSINLALQLVRLGFSAPATTQSIERDWIYRFSHLQQTRHLRIQLKKPDGALVELAGHSPPAKLKDRPPAWFIRLVDTTYSQAEHQITTEDGQSVVLLIQANPLDEITEAWQETLAYFMTTCALILLTFLAVHLVLHKSLRAIDTIVKGLGIIETGDYRNKLPRFSAREYDSIAKAINHMTGVLDRTQRQNRALTQHSLKIQEDERQHLSQELHDEFGQSLTAIKVMAVTAAHEEADTKRITSSITEICDHLMKVVRAMMKQLHPLMLTELGLKATLEDLLQHWSGRNPEIVFQLDCDEAVDLLDKQITIHLFRVIQECLTNTLRHANANRVDIKLSLDEAEARCLRFSFRDNGQGCNLHRIEAGFGLLGMRERIKSLQGSFNAKSEPGAGMQINVTVPL